MCYVLLFSILRLHSISIFFFFNDTATTEIYTLSLHDALPICHLIDKMRDGVGIEELISILAKHLRPGPGTWAQVLDRKSTRLNSSHLVISYAVFCLKKKKNQKHLAPSITPIVVIFISLSSFST